MRKNAIRHRWFRTIKITPYFLVKLYSVTTLHVASDVVKCPLEHCTKKEYSNSDLVERK